MFYKTLNKNQRADFEALVPSFKSSGIELCVIPDISETAFYSELGQDPGQARYPLPPGYDDMLEYEMDETLVIALILIGVRRMTSN